MTSSRASLRKPITRSGSRETAFSVENPYKPGFLDPSTPESFKMSVDAELSFISNAFYQNAEVTSNLPSDEDLGEIEDSLDQIKSELDVLEQEVIRIETETEAGFASIEEELVILGDTDTLLAQQITDLQVSTDAGFAEVHEELNVLVDADTAMAQRVTDLEVSTDQGFASVSDELTVLADADTAMAQRITDLEVETDQGFASIEEDMSVISDDIAGLEAKWSITADVNGKISGIELTNDGIYSEFIVMADRFAVTDGTDTSEPPFEVVNGSTRIKSAYVNTIQSDNWDGGSNGWFISNDGNANFQNVTVNGTVNASNSFTGIGACGNLITCYDVSSPSVAWVNCGHLTVTSPLQENALMVTTREMWGYNYYWRWVDSNGTPLMDEKWYQGSPGTHIDMASFALPKGFTGTLYHQVQDGLEWASLAKHDAYWFLVRAI